MFRTGNGEKNKEENISLEHIYVVIKYLQLEWIFFLYNLSSVQSVFLSLHQVSPVIFPIQQPPVLCDLQLQAGLEVQQHVILLLVAGNVGVELGQLSLQACDHALEACKLCSVACLSLCQGALQRRFLLWSEAKVVKQVVSD